MFAFIRVVLAICVIIPFSFAQEPPPYVDWDLRGDIPNGCGEHFFEAVNITGANSWYGNPVTVVDGPTGGTNFATVAIYNPGGGNQPIPLTPDMEGNIERPYATVLASYLDPAFAAWVGAPVSAFPPQHYNVPIHEVQIINAADGVTRSTPRGTNSVGQIELGIAEPWGAITLGKWLEGRGTCTFLCQGDGTSIMNMKIRNMFPNRIYTTWAGFDGENGLEVYAIGGLPNAIVTDEVGSGTLKRQLNFCPFELKEDEIPLLWILLDFHSDMTIYGNMPSPGGAGLPPGSIGHAQIQFNIGGTVQRRGARPNHPGE